MSEEKIKFFTDLIVWQEAHKLVLSIYKSTESFPRREFYSLIDQMRRATVSVTSNIAEGFSRQTLKEKIQFYSIARGSLTELQNQLMVARDVKYVDINIFDEISAQTVAVHKLLNAIISKTKIISNQSSTF